MLKSWVMKHPLTISVIIPAFNEESHIADCLDALARQEVKPDEVIVVDNNSSDQTAQIVQRYPFVTLIRELNQGLYHSRNKGMNAATGDIVCRIDADTIVPDVWIKNMHVLFQDANVHAATGPVGYHDFAAVRFFLHVERILLRIALILHYKFVFGCNMAMRRETWQQLRGELCDKPFLMEDIDTAMHLKAHGIKPVYSTAISALVSCRRARDPLPAFVRYIRGHSRTARHHNQPLLSAYYSEVAFIFMYLLLRPFVLMYDPITRRFDPKGLFASQVTRPDPMTGEIDA